MTMTILRVSEESNGFPDGSLSTGLPKSSAVAAGIRSVAGVGAISCGGSQPEKKKKRKKEI